MNIETWKILSEFAGKYEVSNFGNVRFCTNKKLLKKSFRGGYVRVWLIEGNFKKQLSIHRLVAKLFIENFYNKPQVNHINGIKDDNRVDNLEWCTNRENVLHAIKTGLKIAPKQSERHKKILKEANGIKVINTVTGIIYESITDAGKNLGYKRSTLIHYLLGTRKNKTSLEYYNV